MLLCNPVFVLRIALQTVVTNHTRSSHMSRHSSGSHTSHLSDLQVSVLDEKKRKDELEELKRQRQEERLLDEQCKSIDERARAAQHMQEDAHKERERIVRQVEIDRRIRIRNMSFSQPNLFLALFIKI